VRRGGEKINKKGEERMKTKKGKKYIISRSFAYFKAALAGIPTTRWYNETL
jgi:hypothetical protein